MLTPVTVRRCCRSSRHFSASWHYSEWPTVTSFFVAGGPSWRKRSVPIHASHFWRRRFANLRQLCAQTERSATNNKSTIPQAALSVKTNFYMDNHLQMSPNVEEALRKAQDFVKRLDKGGFTPTKFVINVRGVLSSLDWRKKSTNGSVKALAAEDASSQILGLQWNYRIGTLTVGRENSPDYNCTVTQRVVLSLVSTLYKHIGLVAPYTVERLKRFLGTKRSTKGLQSSLSHRRQLRRVEWRVNEVNSNNDLRELFRRSVKKNRTPHIRWQLPKRCVLNGFPYRKSDVGQL